MVTSTGSGVGGRSNTSSAGSGPTATSMASTSSSGDGGGPARSFAPDAGRTPECSGDGVWELDPGDSDGDAARSSGRPTAPGGEHELGRGCGGCGG